MDVTIDRWMRAPIEGPVIARRPLLEYLRLFISYARGLEVGN